jgi:hypothetical protein
MQIMNHWSFIGLIQFGQFLDNLLFYAGCPDPSLRGDEVSEATLRQTARNAFRNIEVLASRSLNLEHARRIMSEIPRMRSDCMTFITSLTRPGWVETSSDELRLRRLEEWRANINNLIVRLEYQALAEEYEMGVEPQADPQTSDASEQPPKIVSTKSSKKQPRREPRPEPCEMRSDMKLQEAWDTGHYRTHKDLAKAKGMPL